LANQGNQNCENRRNDRKAETLLKESALADAAQLLDAALAETLAETRPRRALLFERGRISEAQFRYLEAVNYFTQAAKLVPSGSSDVRDQSDGNKAWYLIDEVAHLLVNQYAEFDDPSALRDAIEAYRSALDSAPGSSPWASTQCSLGEALTLLGETDREAMTEAAVAFRAALSVWPQKGVPARANANHALGYVLSRLGDDEEAVAAYRAALQEPSWRGRNWAMTQNNLAIALSRLGERDSGTALLEQAVAAWEACLTVAGADWPADQVREVRFRIDKAQGDIARRTA
jgi:tetratricopeptide (TPR) repeat protein